METAKSKSAAKTPSRGTQQLDASTMTLGRLATKTATFLRGKHKASFVPYLDQGDFVSISNAAKVGLTGKKLTQKTYKHFSGYPGGLKTRKLKDVLEKNPGWVIRQAVWNMLPKNKLRSRMIKRLTISN